MGFRGQSPVGSFQPRLTPAVKILLILYAVVFIVQMSFQQFAGVPVVRLFGFVPVDFVNGWVWQIFTYPFLHDSLTHILFNGIVLYMLGSELEARWGTRRFLTYYGVCAVGGAVLQMLIWGLSFLAFPSVSSALGSVPIVGASGALYGLFMAFGFLFGDSLVLVFFILPMRAKHFVAVLFFIEVVSAVFNSGGGAGGVAHLVHLGGLVTGFLYLRWRGGNLDGRGGGFFGKKRMGRDEMRRRLSVVVNNDSEAGGKPGKYPITWN
jgi:membrane associated rhomboid family serine protease